MVRGGGWGSGGRNKVLKTLEKMPPALKARPRGLEKSRPKKRTLDIQGGTEPKSRKVDKNEGRKQVFLEKWLKKEAKGYGGHPPDPGDMRTGPERQENHQNAEPKVLEPTTVPGTKTDPGLR